MQHTLDGGHSHKVWVQSHTRGDPCGAKSQNHSHTCIRQSLNLRSTLTCNTLFMHHVTLSCDRLRAASQWNIRRCDPAECLPRLELLLNGLGIASTESESDSTSVATLKFSSAEAGGAVRCFGNGTPVYETSDVPGPDEAACGRAGYCNVLRLLRRRPRGSGSRRSSRGRTGFCNVLRLLRHRPQGSGPEQGSRG